MRPEIVKRSPLLIRVFTLTCLLPFNLKGNIDLKKLFCVFDK